MTRRSWLRHTPKMENALKEIAISKEKPAETVLMIERKCEEIYRKYEKGVRERYR